MLKGEEKKEKIKIFKERLADHLLNQAEFNADLERMVLTAETEQEFREDETFFLAGRKRMMPPAMVAKYEEFIRIAWETRRYVETFQEKNKAQKKGVKRVFKDLFGFTPKGDVEIKTRSVALAIVCKNQEDFSRIMTGVSTDDAKEMSEDATRLGGVAGNLAKDENLPTIVMNDDPEQSPWMNTQKLLHEEKHIIDKIAGLVSKEKEPSDVLRDFYKYQEKLDQEATDEELSDDTFYFDLLSKVLMRGALSNREYSEIIAKREIFAYVKNGLSTEKLWEALSTGEHYNVIDQVALSENLNKLPLPGNLDGRRIEQQIKNAVELQSAKYLQDLRSALDAVQKLRDLHLSDSKIVGLFQNTSLGEWRKVYERVKSVL
jgi:hypothetical protein